MVYQMLLFLIDCKTMKNERIEGIFYRYKSGKKSNITIFATA